MINTKKWYQSKTIWAIVVAAFAFFLHNTLQVSPADINVPDNPDFNQLKNIASQVKSAHGNIANIITILIGSASSIAAIYNRVTSDSVIVGKTTPEQSSQYSK